MNRIWAVGGVSLLWFLVSSGLQAGWTESADMIYPRMDNAITIWNSQVFTFGDSSANSSKTEKIAIDGSAWQERQSNSSLPVSVWRGALRGGKYYLFSNPAGLTKRKVFIYDFSENAWSTANLPESNPFVPDLWAPGAVELNGLIYLMGGALSDTSGDQRAVYQYNPDTDQWIQKSSMNRVRNFFCSFVYDNKIWVAGGSGYNLALDACEVYNPNTDIWTENNSVFASLPVSVWGAGDAVYQNKFYVISGVQDNGLTFDVLVYDPQTNQWTAGDPVPYRRYRLDAVADDTGIYVAGGSSTNFTPSPDYVIFQQVSPTRTSIPTFTPPPNPTSTPVSTSTRTPPATQTATPQPSRTPTQIPSRTQTPAATSQTPLPSETPNPSCDELGVKLLMPSRFFVPGSPCYLTARICNTSVPMDLIPLFVFLEVAGQYFFYPEWTESASFQRMDLSVGSTEVVVFPAFTWPEIENALDGLRFYGAATDFGINQLLGSYDIWEFGFGPADQPTPTPIPGKSPTPTSTPGSWFTPTPTPALSPTAEPTELPQMEVIPQADSGSIPGADCAEPEIFCFGLTQAGSESDWSGVAQIHNSGAMELIVTVTEQGGDWDSFQMSSESIILSAGASESIQAKFAPAGISDYVADLLFSGSDGSTFAMSLKGRGIPP